jgi:hypothetical protein
MCSAVRAQGRLDGKSSMSFQRVDGADAVALVVTLLRERMIVGRSFYWVPGLLFARASRQRRMRSSRLQGLSTRSANCRGCAPRPTAFWAKRQGGRARLFPNDGLGSGVPPSRKREARGAVFSQSAMIFFIGGTIAEYIAAMKCMEPFVYVSSQKDGAAPTVSSRPLVRSS